MFPATSFNYMGNGSLGATEFIRKAPETSSIFTQCANFKNLLFCEYGMSLLLSAWRLYKSMQYSECMNLIFRTANDFEIFKKIEFLLSVFMVHIHLIWNGSDKRFNNETMNQSNSFFSLSFTKKRVQVAMSSGSGLHDVGFFSNEAPQSSFITNLVTSFKSENWLPIFDGIHNVLYLNTSGVLYPAI